MKIGVSGGHGDVWVGTRMRGRRYFWRGKGRDSKRFLALAWAQRWIIQQVCNVLSYLGDYLGEREEKKCRIERI